MSRSTGGARYRGPSKAVVWTAVAGAAGAVPYLVMKIYWLAGGTAGKPARMNLGDEFAKNGAPRFLVWLERHGIDFTVVGIMLGIVLLGALVRPWGQVYPRWVPFLRGRRVLRWIPLTPGWTAGLGLGAYGCIGMSVILTGGLSTAHTAGLAPGVFVIGFLNFTSIGVSLSVCSLSYQRRTRTVRA